MSGDRYEELISEGRASIINGLLAYGIAFELLREDEVDEDLAETIGYTLQGLEVMIPPMKALYELDKKRFGSEESFIEWLAHRFDKMK